MDCWPWHVVKAHPVQAKLTQPGDGQVADRAGPGGRVLGVRPTLVPGVLWHKANSFTFTSLGFLRINQGWSTKADGKPWCAMEVRACPSLSWHTPRWHLRHNHASPVVWVRQAGDGCGHPSKSHLGPMLLLKETRLSVWPPFKDTLCRPQPPSAISVWHLQDQTLWDWEPLPSNSCPLKSFHLLIRLLKEDRSGLWARYWKPSQPKRICPLLQKRHAYRWEGAFFLSAIKSPQLFHSGRVPNPWQRSWAKYITISN